MNPYTQKLLTAIAAYESKCGIAEPESILEGLWYDYSCRNPVDDGQLRKDGGELYLRLSELPVIDGISAGVVIPEGFQNGFRGGDAAFGFVGGDGTQQFFGVWVHGDSSRKFFASIA